MKCKDMSNTKQNEELEEIFKEEAFARESFSKKKIINKLNDDLNQLVTKIGDFKNSLEFKKQEHDAFQSEVNQSHSPRFSVEE